MTPDYDTISRWISDNQKWLIFVFAISLLAFPSELSTFNLTIDEEIAAVSHDQKGWITQGRWGQYLLSFIFTPNSIVPFVPIFLTLMLSAIACIITTRVWSQTPSKADFLIAPIFIACPTLYYVYQFNTLNYGIGFGMLSSALAVYLFVYGKGIYRFSAVPFACLAIAIYQAFVPCLAVIYGYHLLGRILAGDPRTPGKYIILSFNFGLMLLMALLLNFTISEILLASTETDSSKYLKLWVKFQPNMPYLINTLELITVEMTKFYFGDKIIYGNTLAPLKYLFIVATLLSLGAIAISKHTYVMKVFAALILIAVIFFPFSLHIMNEGFMPVRTMLAIPLTLSGLVFTASHFNYAKLNILLGLLVMVVFFRFAVANNQMSYADQLSYQADRELTVRLMTRLDSLGLTRLEDGETRPLMLVGYHKRKESALLIQGQDYFDTVGASFYDWQGGSIKRVISLLNIMGINYFHEATATQQLEILEEAEAIPAWPKQGSIAEIAGITVIKLSNFNTSQLITFLGDKKACHKNHSLVDACRVLRKWHPMQHPQNNGISIIRIKRDRVAPEELFFEITRDGQKLTLEHAKLTVSPKNQLTGIRGQGKKAIVTIPAIDISKQQEAVLSLTITVPKRSSMVLRYRYGNAGGYSEKNAASYFLAKGENNLAFKIPGSIFRQDILLSPSTEEGNFLIKNLSISPTSQTTE